MGKGSWIDQTGNRPLASECDDGDRQKRGLGFAALSPRQRTVRTEPPGRDSGSRILTASSKCQRLASPDDLLPSGTVPFSTGRFMFSVRTPIDISPESCSRVIFTSGARIIASRRASFLDLIVSSFHRTSDWNTLIDFVLCTTQISKMRYRMFPDWLWYLAHGKVNLHSFDR